MLVVVQGSNTFDNYSIFMRAMGVAMSGMKDDDKNFYVYSVGPSKVNSFATEFCNLSERGMKARGKKIKLFKVPGSWVEENIDSVDYFAFLSNQKESPSKLVYEAESKNVEVGIFRY